MIYYNDNNKKCCQILRRNIKLGNLQRGIVDERNIEEIKGEDLTGVQQIHLFAGIGGFALGLKWAEWPENLSIITGGFPCQPYSIAGKQRGTADDRYLWPEMFRIIQAVKPTWIFIENVVGLLSFDGGLVVEEMLSSLENEGYEVFPPFIIPACAIDAPQRRDRIWILAHSNGPGLERVLDEKNAVDLRPTSQNIRREWEAEPRIHRVASGISRKLDKDRLIMLGNAVVPQIIEMIGRAILKGFSMS